MCKVAIREVWFTPLQALRRSEHFFSTAGGRGGLFPSASHVQRIPPALGPFPPFRSRSLRLRGTEPSGCSHHRRLEGLSWEGAGHRAMEVCLTLHQHCFSVCPVSGAQEGKAATAGLTSTAEKEILPSWRLEKACWAISPGSSYYKWPYVSISHKSFHYLVKFHLSRSCYWQKLFEHFTALVILSTFEF